MAIPSISSSDLQALRSVNEALLDPLSHETTEAWLLEVCSRFGVLCHAPASLAAFSPRDQRPRFVSPEMPQKYLDRMAELTLMPGSLQTVDDREGIMSGLRQRVSGVATTADLLGPGGLTTDQLQDAPMFRDVAFPLGLPGCTLLMHAGASGEFMVHASYPEIERRAFGEDTPQVLGALLPAFAASIGALTRLGHARQAIATLLDALEDGAVVFDSDGRRVLARNTAMTALAREERNGAGLDRVILQAAQAACWSPSADRSSGASQAQALSRGWHSPAGARYRLRAIRLPAGSVSRDEAIVVLVQRVGPAVPGVRELMRRYNLTGREAEVAHLLAYGRSDREIATELGLSPHTVRHHAEAVFLKTGVTSRKALALHLESRLRPGDPTST